MVIVFFKVLVKISRAVYKSHLKTHLKEMTVRELEALLPPLRMNLISYKITVEVINT